MPYIDVQGMAVWYGMVHHGIIVWRYGTPSSRLVQLRPRSPYSNVHTTGHLYIAKNSNAQLAVEKPITFSRLASRNAQRL